ncbi:MAG TPA: HAMP domain-containing sensor histidine kinase [Candidatus Baltobacteraceae bacterium]|nr:HAMP domain-containing sensor histidine kinase [Candidatus Baltobacteraceae bacterium]
MREPFAPFAARLTRGYVILAIALILLVVTTTSVLAFFLCVGALDDAMAPYAQRAATRAAAYTRERLPLTSYAGTLVNEIGGARAHVTAYDNDHRPIAQSTRHHTSDGRLNRAVAAVFGLHPAVVPVAGGTVVIAPDLEGFTRLLGRYLIVVLPIGALAVLIAWLAGRRIARLAIAPLQRVAVALRGIGAGDFTPQPLPAGGGDLHDLTAAYNELAHRLTTATAQRDRNELQMRQFVADAGHELRTPLTVVMGYLDVLEQGVVSDPNGVAQIYATMLGESRRMRGVIDKLIVLARLERPAPPRTEHIDVTALARRAAQALEPLAGDERIVVTGDGRPHAVIAEESELYESFRNAIENAVRYAPESPVIVDVRSDDANVRVTVTDEGPGMEPQDVEHAFDRFYRGGSKGSTEGSGLGLAIAQRAVERSGGTIAIESRPGAGTKVTIALPRG